MQVLHPKDWAPAKGFANGIAAEGRQVFVAGPGRLGPGPAVRNRRFRRPGRAGAARTSSKCWPRPALRLEHIVRLTWYVTSKTEYVTRLKEVGAAYRRVLGRHFPAMTLVQVVALVEDRAKVEIEATAVVPCAGGA